MHFEPLTCVTCFKPLRKHRDGLECRNLGCPTGKANTSRRTCGGQPMFPPDLLELMTSPGPRRVSQEKGDKEGTSR